MPTGVAARAAHRHDPPILHFDLKPENLFLTHQPDGSELLKVIDFGISKRLDAEGRSIAGLLAGVALVGKNDSGTPSPSDGAPTQAEMSEAFQGNAGETAMALIFWYWMWGVPGAILAVPMLAITKIICDRIRTLASFGHFLEG